MGMQDKFEEMKGKAKGKAAELSGEVKGRSAEAKGKAKGKAAEHSADSDNPVDKATEFINDKTGGKYRETISKAGEKIKNIGGDKK